MQSIQPAGITPASLWSPDALGAPLLAYPVLAPLLAPTTGQRLDLTTSADPTLIAIGQALRTLRGSGVAVEDDGTLLPTIRKNSADAPALVEYEVRRLLAPFVAEGSIAILAVTIDADEGTRAKGVARVKLLRSGGEPQDIPIG